MGLYVVYDGFLHVVVGRERATMGDDYQHFHFPPILINPHPFSSTHSCCPPQAPYPASGNPRALKRTETDVVADGMAYLMRSYEEQLVNPLKNLFTGDLARSLLIQIQKVKVDSEAAMLEIDQILRANELSISLVAAIPAILIAYGVLRGVWRLLTPTAPDPVYEALPARCVGLCGWGGGIVWWGGGVYGWGSGWVTWSVWCVCIHSGCVFM